MNKKKINSILRGMAATGIAIGGVSSIQGTDMVYAAELDSDQSESQIDSASIETSEASSTSTSESDVAASTSTSESDTIVNTGASESDMAASTNSSESETVASNSTAESESPASIVNTFGTTFKAEAISTADPVSVNEETTVTEK